MLTAQMDRAYTQTSRRWIGIAAIAIPLVVLLGIQIRTLAALRESSAVEQRASLKNYARGVVTGVEEFHRLRARAALTIPAALLSAPRDQLASHFAAQNGDGVTRFFAISFAPGEAPIAAFAANGDRAAAPLSPRELRAIKIAAAPWRLLADEGGRVDSVSTDVNEQDPGVRVLMRPVLDGASHVVGVAGLIVDEAYVREQQLPALIAAQRELLPSAVRDAVTAELRPRDEEEPVDEASLRSDSVERPFRFFFTDQALAVESRSVTPEQWMQRSLLLNLLLTLAAMGLLIAAIVAALRNAARATRLSQMKTEFVSNVSHELRTPLSSIRVFGEFLRLGRVTDPKKIREYGESIETESRRLTQLVANILDFSGIESGQRSYRFEKVDAAEIVAETLRSFEVRLEREGFSLEMQTPPAPLPAIWADPLAVAQVVSNLVDNAIKYSGDARTIAVRLAADDDFVSIAVADRGPGIDAEEHERIFDKFYRVVTGLQHDVRGSGLGLSIVKHIMAAHRGSIDVRSEAGAGSSFTTRWPTRDV